MNAGRQNLVFETAEKAIKQADSVLEEIARNKQASAAQLHRFQIQVAANNSRIKGAALVLGTEIHLHNLDKFRTTPIPIGPKEK